MASRWLQSRFNLIKNELPRYTILATWVLVNLAMFLGVYFYYYNALEIFYLRKIVQSGLSFSRASAFCINFNSVLLILAVCRNLISFTRPFLCCSTNLIRTVDKHITYHRYFGYMIILLSVVHTLGHVHNLESFVVAHNPYNTIKPSNVNGTSEADLLAGLVSTLSLLPTTPDGTYLNPIRYSNAIAIWETIKLLPGITGIIMCVALSVIASTSSEYMRRSFYNLFWYSHQIFALLFFVCFVIHGLLGCIRGQTNTDKNNPLRCYLTYSDWSAQSRQCDIPQFSGSMATSWIWVLAPFVLYGIERIMRFTRGLISYKILEYRLHPSNVLELKIDSAGGRRKIAYNAGQYVYLNVPKVAFFEWHPFTVTSAPDDPYLSVHIRCVGDWTTTLCKMMDTGNNKSPGVQFVHIDGPYGTCAEDVFKYECSVLVGAGIGATPYASILKHIWHILNSSSDIQLKRVHFFWICPSIDTFEWFGELLQKLESEMRHKNKSHMLDYKIYLTKGWSLREAKQIASNEDDTYDLFTGLQQKTNYGRPNFDLFFRDFAKNNSGAKQDVGVFFCGPANLSKELHVLSNKYSDDSVRFFYNKESF